MKFKQNLVILSAILVAVLILGTGCFRTTPLVDTDAPKLSTAVYTDVDSSGTVNKNDKITFTFNEEMLTSTVTSTNVATSLLLSAGRYGTGATISWDTTLKICTVTLGASPIIVSGTTVNPAYSVTDTAGNADASSAVTISGLTAITVLSSVSISPSTATGTVGTAMSQSFTASALSTAATTMTSSCTFTWSISPATGRGSLSSTSGTAVTYTLPATGVTAGTATITVTAVYAGVTKTGTAIVTVGAPPTPPTPTVDPAKLFVCDRTGTAKYTAIPPGATAVTVYSDPTNDGSVAFGNGPRAIITLSDFWTTYVGITPNDYIFFTITDSDGWISPITPDGQLPVAPNAIALMKIQATSKDTVTSAPFGNVDGSDQITLFVGVIPVAFSNPTPVGTDMNLLPGHNLFAGDLPTYTRTNTAGHESTFSGADGQIVEIDVPGAAAVITYNNVGPPNDGCVDTNDVITIKYSGNVICTSTLISFPLGSQTIQANLSLGLPDEADLTIIGGPYGPLTEPSVHFNLSSKYIVDFGGGNWAFEHAVGIDWFPGTDF